MFTNRSRKIHDGTNEYEYKPNNTLFEVGKVFPPTEDLERLAEYEKGRRLYEGEFDDLPKRAQQMLKDTPHADRLHSLYLAVNLLDIIVHKPADLMFNEPPTFETGKDPNSVEQQRLSAIVEENDLTALGQEIVVGAGFRGDSFIKTYFSYRQDFSELPTVPAGVEMEAIIESQDPSTVFPELSRGSKKKFKAINIAQIEWVIESNGTETPYLNVERHLAGFINYRRFRLGRETMTTTKYGIPQSQYNIIEEIFDTGREQNMIETGVPMILVRHIPYKSTDAHWRGTGTAKKIQSLIYAINDRLTQIDYILMKHSDPTAYGVDLNTTNIGWGGRYIPVRDGEVAPAYMTWDGKLTDAFKQLETLINLVFQMAETPQWLFGTTIGNAGGTGTSHTDGAAIKARFMPILSKVKRIRTNVDRALRDSLYASQLLENFANIGGDFVPYEAVYPTIRWRDGLPANEKELAEVMQIRTGGLPTIDRLTAIKEIDSLDDIQAQAILDRIEADEKALKPVTPNVFNEEGNVDLDLDEEKDEEIKGETKTEEKDLTDE